MELDTALLRALVVVADEQHVGRAARRLLVSQQAVSKRIARLESLLGTPLFERTGHGVLPTAVGAAMVPRARAILNGVDALVAAARPGERLLRIDVLDEHLAVLRFVLDLVRDEPGAALETTMREHGRSVVDTLRSGEADVAFGRPGPVGDPWPADLRRGTPLLEPFGVLVSAVHPWSRRREVPMAELRGRPLWFPMTGSPPEWRELLDELTAEFSLTVDYTGSTMGFEHFVGRVGAGADLVSLYGMAMRPPPVPGVHVVPIVAPVPVFPWFPMWRHGLPATARTVVEDIVARARAATAEPHPDDAWMPVADRARLP